MSSRCCSRSVIAFALASLFTPGLLPPARAQDEPVPATPPPVKGAVHITFLPPPLKGTLSLGIYDKEGKLVRVLHQAATQKDFVVGLNGFITSWDGKDDAGKTVAAGTYSARGFAVGKIEVEGVAYHGNDWITSEDSPRIRRIIGLGEWRAAEGAGLELQVQLSDSRRGVLPLTSDGMPGEFAAHDPLAKSLEAEAAKTAGVTSWKAVAGQQFGVREGKVVALRDGSWQEIPLKPLEQATFVLPVLDPEKKVGWWLIDRTPAGLEVKRFAADGTFVRRLAIAPGDPVPVDLAARPDDLQVALLEEKAGLQRLRILARQAQTSNVAAPAEGAETVAEWAVTVSREIASSETFAEAATQLAREKPFTPEERISVKLLPNTLAQKAPRNLPLALRLAADGAWLGTADGLPLLRLSETPELRWAVMGRDGASNVTVFQSDGTVIEEFRVRRLGNIMAFDAGDYEPPPAR